MEQKKYGREKEKRKGENLLIGREENQGKERKSEGLTRFSFSPNLLRKKAHRKKEFISILSFILKKNNIIFFLPFYPTK